MYSENNLKKISGGQKRDRPEMWDIHPVGRRSIQIPYRPCMFILIRN